MTISILRALLCVIGGLTTETILEKKGINILSVKGILIGISVGIVFVLILGFLFSFI